MFASCKFSILYCVYSLSLLATSSYAQSCGKANAPIFPTTPTTVLGNDALNGDNGYFGVIAKNVFDGRSLNRNRDCSIADPNECGVPANVLSNTVTTPNNVYVIPSSGSTGDTNPPLISTEAIVMLGLIDSWKLNGKGGELEGYAYYMSDSNSLIKRDWRTKSFKLNGEGTTYTRSGRPGQGCHIDGIPDTPNVKFNQNQVCREVSGKTQCVTSLEGACECGKGPTGADGPDPPIDIYEFTTNVAEAFGTRLRESISSINNPNELGINDIFSNGITQNEKNPAFFTDYSACWVEEDQTDINLIFKAQNALFKQRSEWWIELPIPALTNYQGWNEVAFDAKIIKADETGNGITDSKKSINAIIIALPTDKRSLCDLTTNEEKQEIDKDLKKYENDDFSEAPVIVMETFLVAGTVDTYEKKFFSQEYTFDNGNCLAKGLGGNGVKNLSNEVYYFQKNSAECIALLPTEQPSKSPTKPPTEIPTKGPTESPTENPTPKPTETPTRIPTTNPTQRPSRNPTNSPTQRPSGNPTKRPTSNPTLSPTRNPTRSPTKRPSRNPTRSPSIGPTRGPTVIPTPRPSATPTRRPSATPTTKPSQKPTQKPTLIPTGKPSAQPTTANPSLQPSLRPTSEPSLRPTSGPTPTLALTPPPVPIPLPTIAPIAPVPLSWPPILEPIPPPAEFIIPDPGDPVEPTPTGPTPRSFEDLVLGPTPAVSSDSAQLPTPAALKYLASNVQRSRSRSGARLPQGNRKD